MKYPWISLSITLLLTSCEIKNADEEKVALEATTFEQQEQDTKKERIYRAKSFTSIREFGQRVLDNEIQPKDNIETFACLDSIDDENAQTREFFFRVYRIIAQKSDGALTDAVGSYTKSYFQTFPQEAMDRFKKLSKSEKEHRIHNLAYEFYASGLEYEEDINNYFGSIYDACEECKKDDEVIKIKQDLIELAARMND